MFDEEGAKSTNPPGNLPIEPVDVLAGVEKETMTTSEKMPDAMSAGLLRKKSPLAESMPETMPPAEASSPGKKLLVIGLIVILLVGGGVAAWFFLLPKKEVVPASSLAPEVVTPPVITPPVQTAPVVEPAPIVVTTTTAPLEPAPLVVMQDTDQDGLSDSREIELGTDPKKPDTDNDQLSDGDEVLVWKTNPLNADTDNDKFLDGAEIKNGYSPTGPGKLFPIGTSSTPSVAPSSTYSGPTTVTP